MKKDFLMGIISGLLIISAGVAFFVLNISKKDNSAGTTQKTTIEGQFSEYKESEVRLHNTIDDCWVIESGAVFKIPYSWIEIHPGGQEVFEEYCGTDITEMIEYHITETSKYILKEYLIGKFTKK